jgi:hypothetical protein
MTEGAPLMPTHKHDCDQCKLFATTNKGDWYVCSRPPSGSPLRSLSERSVVLRYSDDGPEYVSLPIMGNSVGTGLILGALTLGLRLTDEEVRRCLASLLVQELPRSAYEYIIDEIDQPYETIYAAVLERPAPQEEQKG